MKKKVTKKKTKKKDYSDAYFSNLIFFECKEKECEKNGVCLFEPVTLYVHKREKTKKDREAFKKAMKRLEKTIRKIAFNTNLHKV